MSVRASLACLERTAARAFGGDGSPCRCQWPMVVIYDEARGATPEPPSNHFGDCGRERTRINVRIVETPRPHQFAGAGAA